MKQFIFFFLCASVIISVNAQTIPVFPAKPNNKTPAKKNEINSKNSTKTFILPEMIVVEGGSFNMGSADGASDEKPIHMVEVKRFSISKYEITQSQWQAIMGSNPSEFAGCITCPVENVSWNDIQDFLKELHAQTGRHYRLPTESEWEFAARGGLRSKGFTYAGSFGVSNVAWHSENSGNQTHPAGQKKPNEIGICDMSGNVWEWCEDWYLVYGTSQLNQESSTLGRLRVIRGGSWGGASSDCRIPNRANQDPAKRSNDTGFRIVADLYN